MTKRKTPPSRNRQSQQNFQCTLPLRIATRYLLFLPQAYEDRPAQHWPLILFLHGAGERGQNLAKVAVHGPPKLVKTQPDFPFVVISPQCPSGQHWSNDLLLPLLEDVLQRYRIDTTRVYVTGMSMGGYGAWRLAVACPERIAAVAPICGGGDIIPILLANPRKLAALRSLPVWAFHGARDDIVPLAEAERMVNALRKVGNDARLTVYPEAGHDSWTETYADPALYRWFLSWPRPRRASP